MRKYIAIIIASLALLTGQAHAQRCLPKMQGIEVRANMVDGFNPGGNDGGYSFGAALSTYTKKGNKWVFGGEYLLKNNPYKDGKIPVAQFTAEGGYYFKILSDARKIVFVYAGASALAGYESVNWGEKVLHDFDLWIKSGQKLAIVGATGSGKTTVVNLLTRFYDIDGGSITLDGESIYDIPKKKLRGSIGIVLQDTVIFNDTIMQNIRYGRLDATDEEVIAAAKTAKVADFAEKMADGYDTMLTEGGGNLSQGQRQLIAIARAVLADPKILILDEATSSIDTRTEVHIQEAMLALMKGRTSLIIAHRLSTIRDADKIVVIDGGKVVEAGNHEKLLSENGAYARLYNTQFAGIKT